MESDAPLILTKLNIPPAQGDVIARTPLTKRIDGGLRRKLTLISAPADFGKTTLIAEWAQQSDQRVGWFSVDQNDNDLHKMRSHP